ncbi:ribonuclease III domain-containing protein [Cantharellus anzutake]|uniref:ribonuclease III domain-containing protein n=1 Tax=Cantharellus anzutake TaxID=1750568 RepID=UPI001904B514|nr:ribonuclease III domain-containing protein [Cantharellus anzutake]KAF8329726.1 ribonuclease III domain-containing protein [Cantharellus anzutake]
MSTPAEPNASFNLPHFSPEEWGSIQQPPPSALHALSARLAFLTSSPSYTPSQKAELLTQALTHSSCLPTIRKYYPRASPPRTNGALASVGNGLLGLFASEWVHSAYPHLPTRAVKAAVSAYVGPRTLADVAKEWGVSPLLRWSRALRNDKDPGVLQVNALASFSRALVALLAHHASLAHARDFTHVHFLSRSVDLEPLLKFRAPKTALTETVAKFGRERPISRLLSETGRYTNTPMFVVGIYSGSDKLGEGFGHSLKMAEHRAAEDSLNRLYLTRHPSHLTQLPTFSFPPSFTSTHSPELLAELLDSNLKTPPQPPILGESEVLYASRGSYEKSSGTSIPKARKESHIKKPVEGRQGSLEDYGVTA